MMLIVLSISIATLIILIAVSFYGIIGSKNMAIETSDDIGKQSSANSSKILEEQMKSELTKLSLDKANDINHRMLLRHSIQLMSCTMKSA